jgi:hypothetical protein
MLRVIEVVTGGWAQPDCEGDRAKNWNPKTLHARSAARVETAYGPYAALSGL